MVEKGEGGDSSMLALQEWGKEEHEKQREKRLDSKEIECNVHNLPE
jgi:hypothetical protein